MAPDLANIPVGDLLAALGEKSPTPGGGAVAALTGAIGAALGLMVVNYSVGKKSLAEHDHLHREALGTLGTLRDRTVELADADAVAYGRVNELMSLDEADARRQRELPIAVRAAIDVPSAVITSSLEMLNLLQRLCGTTNRSLASDLAIAALLAEAAARAAAWNVRINLPMLGDEPAATALEQETSRRLEQA